MANSIRGAASRRPIIFLSAVLTLAVILSLGAATVYAACVPTSYSVTSSGTPAIGNWTNPSVWQPSTGYPGSGACDSASDTNGTPTALLVTSLIPNPIVGLNLNCNGCSIDIQSGGHLTLAGSGTISSAGSIHVYPGGTLTIASGGALASDGIFDIAGGSVDVQSGGQLTLAGSSTVSSTGTVSIGGGAMTVNSPLTIVNGSFLTLNGATVNGSASVENYGTLTQSVASSTMSAVLHNYAGATMTISSGTLDLSGGGSSDAPITIGTDGALVVSGSTFTTSGTGTVSGSGTLGVAGGTLSIGGVTEPGGFDISAGTLTGAGFLSTNRLQWSGGTITGAGGTELTGLGTGNFTGANGAMILDGRTLNIYGRIDYTSGTNALQINNNGLLGIFGTFDIQTGGSITSNNASPAIVISPNGQLIKDSSGNTFTIGAPTNNNASVQVYNGVLAINGNGTHTGNFYVDTSGELTFSAPGSMAFDLNSSVNGPGTVRFFGGTTTFSGSYDISGLTEFCNTSNVTFTKNGKTKNILIDNSALLTLNSNVTFKVTGSGTWSNGTIAGAGTFLLDTGAAMDIDASSGSPTLDGAIFSNNGTVRYFVSAIAGSRRRTDGVMAGPPGVFTLANGPRFDNIGTFDMQTDSRIDWTNTSSVDEAFQKKASQSLSRRRAAPPSDGKSGTSPVVVVSSSGFNNSGTLKKTGASGTSDFQPPVTNTGSVLAQSGTIKFQSFQQTAGSTTLGPGGIDVSNSAMQLDGGVLNGSGTVTGSVQDHGGEIAPGSATTTIGSITVTGNYAMLSASSKLTIKISGAASTFYDVVDVTGTATLTGTFKAKLISGYEPAGGETFNVLTYSSEGGTFTTEDLPPFAGSHGSWTSAYGPTAYSLTAVVSPSSSDLSPVVSGPASYNAGATGLQYTVKVYNAGPDPTGTGTVTLANTLPAGVTAASGTGLGWTCGAPTAGIITCTSTTSITSGSDSNTITFTMTAPPNGGNVSDSATVSFASDGNGTNNTSSAPTTITPIADVVITKVNAGPAGVTAGQNVPYTISVTNNGPSTATNIVVTDPTPANLTFVSATPSQGSCSGTTTVTCNLGSLAANSSPATISMIYGTSPSFSGTVTNIASVTATEDSTPSNAQASTNVGAQSNLSITKSGTSSVNPGQNVTYTINYSNAGPSPATSTVISDPTPVGIAFQSATAPCATGFPCPLGTLAAGQSGSVTVTYTVPGNYSGATIVNTASISSSVNDPNNADNSSTFTTNVTQQTDVQISKTGPQAVSPGQLLSYVITVTNIGPANANGVVVTDITPPGVTFVSATPLQGSCSGTTTVNCNLGALNASTSTTINITYNVPASYAGSTISNTASVSFSGSDSNTSNDSSTATTTVVAQADLSISKTGPGSFAAGSDVIYTIVVTNNGPLTSNNVFVSDPTPPGLTFVSNTGACSGPFPCGLGSIGVSQTRTINAKFNVPANYAGLSIVNTASVSSSTTDLTSANDSSTATTPRNTNPGTDLAVSKTGPQSADTQTTVTFTVVVSNNGPLNATGVVINDPTPVGLSFISNSGGCATAYPCNVASLAAGQNVTITSKYFVQALAGASINNIASVTSSAPDNQTSNDSSTAHLDVTSPQPCPQFPPVLTAPANNAVVNSPVTLTWGPVNDATGYVITIVGGGPIPQTFTAGGTSLTVTLPNGTYNWSVLAVGGDGGCQAQASGTFTFKVCQSLTAAPLASVIGQSTTGQTYAVSWTAVDGATSYELQEATDATFSSATTVTQSAVTRSIRKTVTVATAFFYRVRGISACGGTSPYSTVISVAVVPVPDPGTLGPSVNAPVGSTQPITFQIFIPGLPSGTTSFVATVDKPWLSVVPTAGLVPPEGINLTISADPSTLPNGTWTGTVLVVYGTSGVSSKVGTDGSTSTAVPVSVNIVTPVTPAPLSGPANSAVVIPSVGHLAGLDSNWRSDVRIANVTSRAAKFMLSFNNGGSSMKQTTVTIDGGATTALDDIVRNWYGVGSLGESSNGVLTIQPLDANGKPVAADPSVSKVTVVSSRTYNASSAGTLGQFIPATPFTSFIGKPLAGAQAQVLSLQQLTQSDVFRTNLGLVEAAGKSASLLLSVFDGSGAKITDIPLSLKAGEQKQLNSFLASNGIPTLSNGRVEVQVLTGDGRVTAYASVIDGRSADPFLISGQLLGGLGSSRFVVPGVADLNTGAASWRSDVRVFNSGAAPASATATFYPSGDAAHSISKVVQVNPGEVKALDNVLQSLFGTKDVGGTLHVTTNVTAPLVVTARTYDDTGKGTLGQFIPAVTPDDAVGSNDRALNILQAEESVRYRTNIGLAEVTGKPVTAEITVVLPDSKVTPTVQIPLGAFESRQIPVLSSLGLGAVYNTRITVRVIDGDGKVTAYGSVIDKATLDPTYIPAQ
jgi:uncharacterized repeat protein (TIGR01451 family)